MARINKSLDVADENKGVLLRKQSVPHWKKWNQICNNQSGGDWDRECSPVALWTRAGCQRWLEPGLWGSPSCTGASQCTQSSTYPNHADDVFVADTWCFEMMVMFSLPLSVFFLSLSLWLLSRNWPADMGKGPEVPCALWGRLQRLN